MHMCVCVCAGFEGFRCISDASYHIWVSAAVLQGWKRGQKLGFQGGARILISSPKSAFRTRSTELLGDFSCIGKVGDEASSVARERIAVMMSKLDDCLRADRQTDHRWGAS